MQSVLSSMLFGSAHVLDTASMLRGTCDNMYGHTVIINLFLDAKACGTVSPA